MCLLVERLYLPRQDSSPGKSHKRGLSRRALCCHCSVWVLPSCPVQAQHDESTASPPCGTQPCLNTCTPLGPLVSAVPSEAPCASADTGQQRRSLAPLNVPMGVRGSFHSLVQLAARLAVGIGLIQGGRQICREKTTQPSVALGISCKDKISIYVNKIPFFQPRELIPLLPLFALLRAQLTLPWTPVLQDLRLKGAAFPDYP